MTVGRGDDARRRVRPRPERVGGRRSRVRRDFFGLATLASSGWFNSQGPLRHPACAASSCSARAASASSASSAFRVCSPRSTRTRGRPTEYRFGVSLLGRGQRAPVRLHLRGRRPRRLASRPRRAAATRRPGRDGHRPDQDPVRQGLEDRAVQDRHVQLPSRSTSPATAPRDPTVGRRFDAAAALGRRRPVPEHGRPRRRGTAASRAAASADGDDRRPTRSSSSSTSAAPPARRDDPRQGHGPREDLTGVKKIYAYGGDGNDTIIVREGVLVPTSSCTAAAATTCSIYEGSGDADALRRRRRRLPRDRPDGHRHASRSTAATATTSSSTTAPAARAVDGGSGQRQISSAARRRHAHGGDGGDEIDGRGGNDIIDAGRGDDLIRLGRRRRVGRPPDDRGRHAATDFLVITATTGADDLTSRASRVDADIEVDAR